jgi:predicted Zn-dependent protease
MRTCAVAIVLAIALAAPVAPAATRAERQSEEVFAQMKAQIPIARSVRAQRYVECVARNIIAQLEPAYANRTWEIVLFNHKSVNAFAMPGGKIGVFAGLLRVATDQNQLAAVIGHEIAHVTARHAEQRASRRTMTDVATTAATVLLGGDYLTRQAIGNALSLGAELGLNRPYDRGQETEADERGLRYMAMAGFDPRASIELWKRMSHIDQAAPPEFLSTHPSTEARLDLIVGQLSSALQAYNLAQAQGRNPDCLLVAGAIGRQPAPSPLPR